MDASKKLARLLGPSIVAVVGAELPFVQPGLYDQQTPAGVYGSGMLMFIGGLAIVLSHNLWVRDWRILNTLVGWAMLLLGLVRLYTATAYVATAKGAFSWYVTASELLLIAVGLGLCYFGYRREKPPGAGE